MIRKLIQCALALLPVFAAAPACAADSYPIRPISLVVAYAPGGSTDVAARILAVRLGEVLGTPVVVVNKVGAGGRIGSRFVAASAPDGYTIQIGVQTTHAVAPAFYKEVGYNPLTDFTSLCEVAYSPLVLLRHPTFPPKSVKDLIDYARSHPELNHAIGTMGDGTHMAALLLDNMAKINPQVVAYKGEGEALPQVVGNQLPYMFSGIPSTISLIQSGKLAAMAVTGATRSPLLPEIPTMAEAGLNGYNMVNWFGIFGPAGMPRNIVDKLADGFRQAVSDPATAKRLNDMGFETKWSSPADFSAFVTAENKRWATVLSEQHHQKQ